MGASSFDAFSGLGKHVNRFQSECIPNQGPIPRGEYYIFDRQIGGRFAWLWDIVHSHKKDWFALYPADEKIDDERLCDEIKRGAFRLHPKGDFGISEGCITVESWTDYQRVKSLFKCTKKEKMPGSDLDCYGSVRVW